MVEQCGEFIFCQIIHVRTDIRTDISIFMKLMTTKPGKQEHLVEVTQTRLIK